MRTKWRYLSAWRKPSWAADMFRCLARLDGVGDPRWRTDLVRGALRSPDVSQRDAAIQAAEEWGDPETNAVLGAHYDRETERFLRDYTEGVLRDPLRPSK